MKLKNLRELQYYGNSLKELPADIANLENLVVRFLFVEVQTFGPNRELPLSTYSAYWLRLFESTFEI